MSAKTLCVSLALIIALASMLTLAQTQPRCFPKGNANENALQLVGIKTGLLPATENLSKMGVGFYDFTVVSSNQVQLHLYAKSNVTARSGRVSQ